jgi:DNA invertase Pin-like site-specific DNA recombinase
MADVHAFLYARVSTADKEQDPAPQLAEMREYSQRRGWTFEEFTDIVSSGKVRPELERMLALIRRGKGQAILCRHFDRVARTARELVMLAEELIALNVTFVSLNQQVDTTTPMGKFCFTVIAAAAELERSMIRERVRLGLAAARARGKTLGRPRRIADTAKILQMRRSGSHWSEVSAACGVSPATARRLAKSAQDAQKPASKPGKKATENKALAGRVKRRS